MSDFPERRTDVELRDRLTRIDVRGEVALEELGKLRQVVHPLISQVSGLSLLAEEAREDRVELGVKLEKLGDKIDPILVASAQLATTVATHVEQCKVERTADDQRYKELSHRSSRIERTIYIATGAAALLSGLGWGGLKMLGH